MFSVIVPLLCWLQTPRYASRVLDNVAASLSSFCLALLLFAVFSFVRYTSCILAGSAPLFPFRFRIRNMVSPIYMIGVIGVSSVPTIYMGFILELLLASSCIYWWISWVASSSDNFQRVHWAGSTEGGRHIKRNAS